MKISRGYIYLIFAYLISASNLSFAQDLNPRISENQQSTQTLTRNDQEMLQAAFALSQSGDTPIESARITEIYSKCESKAVRCACLMIILNHLHNTGMWEEMLIIKQDLMREYIENRSQLDADVLSLIAAYYSNNIFFPPSSQFRDATADQATEYWLKHYRDVNEALKIYTFITSTFDQRYAVTAKTFSIISFYQFSRGNHSECYKNSLIFLIVKNEELYGLEHYHIGLRKFITPENFLWSEITHYDIDTKKAWTRAADSAIKLPDSFQKLSALLPLVEGNSEALAYIEARSEEITK